MQTETERNIQKGVEQLLRGLFIAIRNPRSHEQIANSKQTADPIIFFIDYLLTLIIASEDPFTIEKFSKKVFDPDFVESERYAELLVSEIPINKRLETTIVVFMMRLNGDGKKLYYLFNAILNILSEDEINQFLLVVSDDLRSQNDEKAIRLVLQVLPPSLWQNLTEVSRLRIENKLLHSVSEGEMDVNFHRTEKGGLGTWARNFVQYFELRDKFANALIKKLENGTKWEKGYVLKFFFSTLPKIMVSPYSRKRCINIIADGMREDNDLFIDALVDNFNEVPDDWKNELNEKLKDLTDPDRPLLYLPDGTPFLKRPEFEDDDIPF